MASCRQRMNDDGRELTPAVGADLPGLAGCCKCPRLVAHLAELPPSRGRSRREYWNAPVPGFGDRLARICLVGLAPGAHGANRTGRPFTGDGAGDFMYPLLHEAGLANQPTVSGPEDGLELRDLFITNAVRCLPPQNKPSLEEFRNCLPFLEQELGALPRLRVLLLLGQGAYTSYLRLLKQQGEITSLSEAPFGHGEVLRPRRGPLVVASYHTSRYNIQTGRLTRPMFADLLERVKELAES